MPKFEIEQATLTYKWEFSRILNHLPGPGTSPFSTLTRRLQKYDVSPSEISLDAPSSRLSEVILSIALFGGRGLVRINLAWVEVFVRDLADEDEPALLDIADALITTLKEIDEEVIKGRINITYRAHLSLPNDEADQFIGAYLVTKSNLIPEGFVYKLPPFGGDSQTTDPRLVIARSVLVDNGVYIDLTVDYIVDGEPLEPARRLLGDLLKALVLFELEPLHSLEGGTA